MQGTPEETYEALLARNEVLQLQLDEAESIIEAIRNGEVDALIVKKDNEPQIYSLKSADHTYRVFIEKMNDGAITLDRDGIIIYCNSSFSNMVNIPSEEMLGTSFLDIIPSAYAEEVNGLLQKGWNGDSKTEMIFPGKNNRNMPVMLSLSPLEIDGGQSLSIIITDLSFQKETQQQKKSLEQKDEFISIASHELKTPVTSIKGYIQLLRYTFKDIDDAKIEEMLVKADAQITKLMSLISELLDVKKIETGQLKYHEEDFDLCKLVKDMVAELENFTDSHTLSFKNDCPCMVHGDPNKIGQVISNLLENAIKYSPAHTPISVEVTAVNGEACCSVQDFGMGIPADQLSKIFERFYRVDGKVENTFSGLGLGLYISAEIIKKHRGKLSVDSEYGKGSVFQFRLPLI